MQTSTRYSLIQNGFEKNENYGYDESPHGQKIVVPDMQYDTFGTNQGGDNFFDQGNGISWLPKLIPGGQAVSKPHDWAQTTFTHLSPTSNTLRNWANVPAMFPAAVVTYGALVAPLAPTLISSD